jgi:hypothetical protein
MSTRRGRVELAVMYSVRHATWLTPADRAAVTEARLLASQIDQLTGTAGTGSLFDTAAPVAEVAGKVGFLANSLMAVLIQLGLTPAGRANIGADDLGGDDATLAEIRAIRAGPQTAAGDLDRDR